MNATVGLGRAVNNPASCGVTMTGARAAGLTGREADAAAASAVKTAQADGRHAEARERYAELVGRHQRRASRIAFHYMRDAAEADEAVQDAFVKAYSHLASFREELPFEVWFTRILINGCLDRIKARTRRERWIAPMPDGPSGERDFGERVAGRGPSPEDQLLARERRERLALALAKLPERQRSVFMLSHYEGCTSREVSALTGLNESTVRVHLFRAIRKLRTLLSDIPSAKRALEKRHVTP
jgi:RNA polymerase sigma-70 factor, ECF subfamily